MAIPLSQESVSHKRQQVEDALHTINQWVQEPLNQHDVNVTMAINQATYPHQMGYVERIVYRGTVVPVMGPILEYRFEVKPGETFPNLPNVFREMTGREGVRTGVRSHNDGDRVWAYELSTHGQTAEMLLRALAVIATHPHALVRDFGVRRTRERSELNTPPEVRRALINQAQQAQQVREVVTLSDGTIVERNPATGLLRPVTGPRPSQQNNEAQLTKDEPPPKPHGFRKIGKLPD